MAFAYVRAQRSPKSYCPHEVNMNESHHIHKKSLRNSPAVSIATLDIPKASTVRSGPLSTPSHSNSIKRGSDTMASRPKARVQQIKNMSRYDSAKRGNNASVPLQSRPTAGETTCLAGHHATVCRDESRPCMLQPQTDVNLVNITWNAPDTHIKKLRTQTHPLVQKRRTNLESVATHTRYRESATQTVPYLPTPANTQAELDDLELYRVSTVLPGDGPPGLYEVEVLERHRRRWEFMNALQRLKESGRENVIDTKKMKTIIEAFEWENWIQREEYLQECQGLRFNMVACMFEEREKKMASLSQKRLEKATERITAKRDAAIKKIKTEYGRKARRSEAELRKLPRNYRQESIIKLLADPISDFHAPQTRYGVNPNRRNFAERGQFEERMLLLEKEILANEPLECPFAKLKEWSAPKQEVTEIQQNFLTDNNLKKLYETLKRLRLEIVRHKTLPKCLIIKSRRTQVQSKQSSMITDSNDKKKKPHVASKRAPKQSTEEDSSHEREIERLRLQLQELKEREWAERVAKDNHTEEIDHMIAEFEGSTIGHLIDFLSKEAIRVDDLERLKFLNTVARKERWGREAAESGLRQKEHHLREDMETLYHQSNDVNTKRAFAYLKHTVDQFIEEKAETKAASCITNLAKNLDERIGNWLKSVKVIQNPKNYRALRYLLKDLIFPQLEALVQQYESQYIAGSVVDKVLLPKVKKELEPYDVSYSITTDMVDRLIDNDLYLFSEDSADECCVTKLEIRAVLRKLTRWAVAGRRWKTPKDRQVDEQIIEFLDDVFETITCEEEKSKHQRKLHAIFSSPAEADSLRGECQSELKYGDIDEGPSVLLQATSYGLLRSIYDDKEMFSHLEWGDEPRVEISLLDFLEKDLEAHEKEAEFAKSDKTIDHYETANESIDAIVGRETQRLIHHIISEFIPDDDSEDDFEEFEQELEEENGEVPYETDSTEQNLNKTPHCVAKSLLNNILTNIPSTTCPVAESETVAEETAPRDSPKFELIIGKPELDTILSPTCKCRMEKEREEYIRELMRRGKVKIVPNLREEDEEEYEINDESFEPGSKEFEILSDFYESYDYDDDLWINSEDSTAEENLQLGIMKQPQVVLDMANGDQSEVSALPLGDVAQPEEAFVLEPTVMPEVPIVVDAAVVPEAAVVLEPTVVPELPAAAEAVLAPEPNDVSEPSDGQKIA